MIHALTHISKFRFVKNFFWFSDEPLSQEGVDAYIKSEKGELAHHNAAWAQETGRGVLFYAKRAEDKATPSGIILVVCFASPLRKNLNLTFPRPRLAA